MSNLNPWETLQNGDELELEVCDDRFAVSSVGACPMERGRRVVATNKRTGHPFRIEWQGGTDRPPLNWGVVTAIYRKWAEVHLGDWMRLRAGDEISLRNGSRYKFIKRERSNNRTLLIFYSLSEKTLHQIEFVDGDINPPEKWSLVVAIYSEDSPDPSATP